MTDEEKTTEGASEEAPEEAPESPKVRYVQLEKLLGFSGEEEVHPLIDPILKTWEKYFINRGQNVSIYDRPIKALSTIHFKTRAEREACLKGFLAVDLILYYDSHEVGQKTVDPWKWKMQLVKRGYLPAPGLVIPLTKVAALGVAGLDILAAPDQPDLNVDERLQRLINAWLVTKEEKIAFLTGWIIQGGIYNSYQKMETERADLRAKIDQMKKQGGTNP